MSEDFLLCDSNDQYALADSTRTFMYKFKWSGWHVRLSAHVHVEEVNLFFPAQEIRQKINTRGWFHLIHLLEMGWCQETETEEAEVAFKSSPNGQFVDTSAEVV